MATSKKRKRASASPDRPLNFEDPLLTVPQVAEALGVTERWVRRALGECRLPYVKVGKLVRVQRSDVVAFIEAQRIPPRGVVR
jgi:excisionase family DNA binding protein